MSRLDELIAELCPYGVENLQLSDVANYSSSRIDATEVDAESYIGVENLLPDKRGKTDSSYVPETGRLTGFIDGDILIGNIRPYLKKIWLATNDGGTNGDVLVVQIKDRKILSPKYLFYVLSSDKFFTYDMQNAKGGKMPRGSKSAVLKYPIPLPPLQVQLEIVRILDNFTELTNELTNELATEYENRKKQYEYYNNDLFLQSGMTSDWMSVGDVILSLKTGLNPRQNFTLNNGGTLPYITGKDIYGNQINVTNKTDLISIEALKLINKRAALEKDDVLFASTGTGTVGRMAVITNYQNDWGISETLYALKPKSDVISPIYLMYSLYSKSSRDQFEPKISRSSVPHLKVVDLLSVRIPVPPIIEQNRIVKLLSRFDFIHSGLTSSLQSEIESRRAQYEHYRDKLLTFQEA